MWSKRSHPKVGRDHQGEVSYDCGPPKRERRPQAEGRRAQPRALRQAELTTGSVAHRK